MINESLIKPCTLIHVGTEYIEEFVVYLYSIGFSWRKVPLETALDAAKFFSERHNNDISVYIKKDHFAFANKKDPYSCDRLEFEDIFMLPNINFDDIDNII